MTARMAALRANPWTMRLVLVVLALAFLSTLTLRFGAGAAQAGKGYKVPTDARLESTLGIRFTQAVVVGDGGLIELSYVVLDTEKASKFQSNTQHPPVLYNEGKRNDTNAVYRTALMRQGHTLRPGQTYFIIYQNHNAAVKPGDTIEIDAGGSKLVKVPVR